MNTVQRLRYNNDLTYLGENGARDGSRVRARIANVINTSSPEWIYLHDSFLRLRDYPIARLKRSRTNNGCDNFRRVYPRVVMQNFDGRVERIDRHRNSRDCFVYNRANFLCDFISTRNTFR